MLPRFIDSWETLPRASGSHLKERFWFDLKATYAPDKRAEAAKDVAAFANTVGGALIIGAREGDTEPDYSSPLQSDYAAKIESMVDEAVRDFCRPSPTVHVRTIPIPTENGKVILVVNVEAFVDQPVAARHEADPRAWRFPHRVGRHTEFLFPEQLPMYMNSKARRAKLMLLRVLDAGGAIDLYTVPSGSSKHATIWGPSPYVVEAVDPDGGGAVVLRYAGKSGDQSVSVPIDDVEAVWLQQTDRWAVRLSGRMERFTAADLSVVDQLEYTPPTTFVVSPLGRVVEELSQHVRALGQTLRGTLVIQQHERIEPSEAAIAERAHQLWSLRVQHDTPGSPANDWLLARKQLLVAQRDD